MAKSKMQEGIYDESFAQIRRHAKLRPAALLLMMLLVTLLALSGCSKGGESETSSDAASSGEDAVVASKTENADSAADNAFREYMRGIVDNAKEYDNGYPLYTIEEYESGSAKALRLCYAVQDFDGDGQSEMLELRASAEFDENGNFRYDDASWFPDLVLYEYDGSTVKETASFEIPYVIKNSGNNYIGNQAVAELVKNASYFNCGAVIFRDAVPEAGPTLVVLLLDSRFDEKLGRNNGQECVYYRYDGDKYTRATITAMYANESVELSEDEYKEELDLFHHDENGNSYEQFVPEFVDLKQ